jgi:hypothetical protein
VAEERSRKSRGVCSVCDLAGRVWHFSERVIAKVNGFEIVEGATLCQTCLDLLVLEALEDSSKPS